MHALILCLAMASPPGEAPDAEVRQDLSEMPSWVVDAPVGGLLAPSATGGVRGVLAPSLRLTWLAPASGRFRTGLEALAFGAFEDAGTDRIRASSWLLGLEGGGLMGWAFGNQKARLMPYLWASLFAAGGAADRRVDDTVDRRAILEAGGFAGVGLQVQVFWFSLRLDFGMGALGDELAGRGRAAVGGTF